MAATAVGLFADAGIADSVVEALRAHGMPLKGIRVVSRVGLGAGDDGQAQQTPHPGNRRMGNAPTMEAESAPAADFAKGLLRELRVLGASETESRAYLAGLAEGNVLIFLTGTLQQADAASAIMNQYAPYDVEDRNVDIPMPPAVHQVSPEAGQPGSSRQKGDGARLFSW